jgi:hypothetical protein
MVSADLPQGNTFDEMIPLHLLLGGAVVDRCDFDNSFPSGFSRWGVAQVSIRFPPMSRKTSETWGTPKSGYAAGGLTLITKISVSFIFTGPASPLRYQRKLLHFHNSGESTNPRVTGSRWI